ncbi:MAG: P-loop NTPase [Alphaproteobacteria bacterium]|jgi:flagellar biosynthesis protein FlhG|nr:P-loop NTPase [Alphaproteobacteria bacterium]
MKNVTMARAETMDTASEVNTLAVASGKGGVGKTWVSITLAHAFAMRGQRALLFDADLGLANVDIQLGLMPKRDLAAVLDGTVSLRNATMRFDEGGFDIIAGRSGSNSLASLPPRRLAEMNDDLAALARRYDRMIFDLAAGIDRNVRHLAASAATVLVVTTDEPTAMTDAYAFIKVINAMKPDADMRIIINMAPSRKDGQRIYSTLLKACQSFLNRSPPLAGIIRHDRAVREAIRAQVPILIRTPNADAARDVDAIAEMFCTTP